MKVSICVPIYGMEDGLKFLKRNISSIMNQTFKDYEIIVSDDSENDYFEKWFYEHPYIPVKYVRNQKTKGIAGNTNFAIDNAVGEIIKIMYQDDFFYQRTSLRDIVKHFTPTTYWLATGCIHTWDGVNLVNPHYPYYSESQNTLGSPSVTAFKREVQTRFNPNYQWVVDLDFYKRLKKERGRPKIINDINVIIGWHMGQATHKISGEKKELEHKLLTNK